MAKIREAGPQDFEAVAALLAELGRPAILGGPDEHDHRARYQEWLDTPNDAFDGLKPLEIIERGEIDRLWNMIFYLESGRAS